MLETKLCWALQRLTPMENPATVINPRHANADRSTIRIHSMHKWPGAVVFDTSQPTIVPPAGRPARRRLPFVAAPRGLCSAPNPNLRPPPHPLLAPAAASKHVYARSWGGAPVRSARIASARSARIASYEQSNYEMFGFRALFSSNFRTKRSSTPHSGWPSRPVPQDNGLLLPRELPRTLELGKRAYQCRGRMWR